MREVYLYRCVGCGNVICEMCDRGMSFYLDQCPACKDWSDYERIMISQGANGYKESQCYVQEEEKEEKEDGNSNTGTNKET